MTYEINPTGLKGSFAYRYEYQTATNHYFGYCETIAEGLSILREAGVY